jgi:hypothetical protein
MIIEKLIGLRIGALTGIGLFLIGVPADANEATPQSEPAGWNWAISIGASSWSDLSGLETTSGQEFDSLGFSLEFGGHKKVARLGFADVLIGADLGFITTDGEIRGVFEAFTQRAMYLTPSVKFRFGERSERYLNLETGLGWYNTDFAELDCNSGSIVCTELAAPFDSDAVGMYVGVAGGFGRWFVAGLKVHYADFGEVTGIGSVAGDLRGPIYVFSLGAAFGE